MHSSQSVRFLCMEYNYSSLKWLNNVHKLGFLEGTQVSYGTIKQNARYYQAVSSNRVLCVLEREILESTMTSYNSNITINFYNSFQSKGTPNPALHLLSFICSRLYSFFFFFAPLQQVWRYNNGLLCLSLSKVKKKEDVTEQEQDDTNKL